jgi:hypothetical protein
MLQFSEIIGFSFNAAGKLIVGTLIWRHAEEPGQDSILQPDIVSGM